ncbi:MAG: hypothetical protein MR815_01870 [Oscillospiraceae bacterium]|nr:hypothetical protein [Oscillospiraceae bacterium]
MNRREAVSLKPFRRTGFNVPLHCPLPKCRARGSWGTLPHACFSCFVLFASSKENEVASAKPALQLIVASEQFRKISPLRLLFLIALTTEEDIGTRSGRAGPSFSVRPEKEAKGAVLHGTSAAERFSHEPTRSANLPKLDDSHRLKHMGRFVFALRAKIPSRATQ